MGAPFLVLALGNDLLGDDGAGLHTARALQKEFPPEHFDFVDTSEAGLALMEIMTGYEKVLILDSIVTGKHEPGKVLEFSQDDFQAIVAPSPHYAGIPEIFNMAAHLGIDFPKIVRILAIEVVNPYEFNENSFTPPVQKALPEYIRQSADILKEWQQELKCTNTP